MVNSKDFTQNSNSYYRPSLDDDDKTFFPKQGTLPLYFFQNGIYQPQQQEEEQLFIEEFATDKIDQNNINYSLYFIFLLIFICFFSIKWISGKMGTLRQDF
jgi:hypothetical protein